MELFKMVILPKKEKQTLRQTKHQSRPQSKGSKFDITRNFQSKMIKPKSIDQSEVNFK